MYSRMVGHVIWHQDEDYRRIRGESYVREKKAETTKIDQGDQRAYMYQKLELRFSLLSWLYKPKIPNFRHLLKSHENSRCCILGTCMHTCVRTYITKLVYNAALVV